jgi:hypothetical protein
MNVATKLKIEQMGKDIVELRQLVAELRESVAYLQGEQVGRRLDQRQQIIEDGVACVVANQKPSPEPRYDPAFEPKPSRTLSLPVKHG